MTADDADADETIDSECLGEFPSLEAFVRGTLAPLLPDGLHWLLDCLDLDRVLWAMTADGRDRLRLEGGRVYLDRLDRHTRPPA
jgi:hypothetical protein